MQISCNEPIKNAVRNAAEQKAVFPFLNPVSQVHYLTMCLIPEKYH